MRTYKNVWIPLVLAAGTPALAWAQPDAHQPATPQASSAELNQCLRVQPIIENIITAASSRAGAATDVSCSTGPVAR